MKKCPACDREYRATARRVVLADGRGSRRALVCPQCADKGVTVVARTTPTVHKAAPDFQSLDFVERQVRTFRNSAQTGAMGDVDRALEIYDQVLGAIERAREIAS